MKLHQQIIEGSVPIPVQLTLREIIRDGKVTNPYQIFVLAWVSEFFKNGIKIDSDLEMPITPGSQATHTATVNVLKALEPVDQVALASYLLDCIHAGESAMSNASFSIADWTKLVLRKQD